MIGELRPDGSVHLQATVEAIIRTGGTISEDYIGDAENFDQMTDASGQPVKFTLHEDGNPFYVVTLNQPVAPGAKYSLTVGLTMTNLVQPAAEPGVCEFQLKDWPDDECTVHSLEEYRLPPGAVLLSQRPADFKAATNDGRIALRIDRTIPPGGGRETDFRYRLPVVAK